MISVKTNQGHSFLIISVNNIFTGKDVLPNNFNDAN